MIKEFKELYAVVVDDHKSTRARLVAVLSGLGIKTTEAENGVEAVDILENDKENIDILLTDVVMPEMDGFELCAEIRRMHKYRKLPIVVLSTHCDTNYIMKALRYGADDYIAKPMDPSLVEKVIRRILTPIVEDKAIV